MRARRIHEEEFTRGGDPYAKLNIGKNRKWRIGDRFVLRDDLYESQGDDDAAKYPYPPGDWDEFVWDPKRSQYRIPAEVEAHGRFADSYTIVKKGRVFRLDRIEPPGGGDGKHGSNIWTENPYYANKIGIMIFWFNDNTPSYENEYFPELWFEQFPESWDRLN